MPSFNAKSVADQVIDRVRKGKKVNMQEIQQNAGYSKTSAIAMKATRTITYKENIASFVGRLEKERSRILMELQGKDLSKERYITLVQAMDTITKNTQLLQGKSTENIATVVNVVDYSTTE